MLQYRQCKIKYERVSREAELESIRKKIAGQLHIPEREIKKMRLERKSLDARKKPELFYDYTVVFECRNESDVLVKNRKNKNLSVFVLQPDLSEVALAYRTREGENGENTRNSENAGNEENDGNTENSGNTGNAGNAGNSTVLIVGAGPAGLMCGYFLALCGRKPVIIERGGPMWERVDKVSKFWNEGKLDADTNVSFGEGGAGTFSDGKLNTGVKDKTGKKQFILDTFVKHGAPEEIRYLAKPHIGTDMLRGVIRSMRETIEERGGTYLFHHKLVGFRQEKGSYGDSAAGGSAAGDAGHRRLTGIYIQDESGEEQLLAGNTCVLAIGHSARDTFELLKEAGIRMEQKPFAVGVRVEHPQRKINEIQYGTDDDSLPAADYKLTGTTRDGRGVYSFCMCPGGYVVNASTEEGMTVVNGMSDHARDSGRANSAVIVTVSEQDFGSGDVLAGVEFQRELERRTFRAGNGKIPVQRFRDFADDGAAANENRECTLSAGNGEIPTLPCTKGGFVQADVRSILPGYISEGIVEGMRQFGRKIKGFDDGDTWILGTETRTSSPVRIVRNRELVSESMVGLYPCGEGAGYAGGIMSAAMDGLRVALQIIGQTAAGNADHWEKRKDEEYEK